MDLISEVSEELAYYIHAEKKACLPGLGCFEAVYQSAGLDPSTDILTAPAETVFFGIAIEEDSHFVQYLAEQLPIKGVYESFKQKVIDLLMSDAEVLLPGLGQLKANQKGEILFEHVEDDEFSFDFADLALQPVPKIEDPTVNIATNAPRAATEQAQKNDQGMSFLKIGMLAMVSALCLVIYFNEDSKEAVQAVPRQVSNKINVSPKAIKNEVYIAAEGSSGMSERLEENDKAAIIKRQDAMTAPIPAKVSTYQIEIITNTFRSRENVDLQIEFIKSLGYRSAELEKDSGLIATMILLSYTDEEELTTLLEKVKQDFPRAKVKK